MSLPSEGDRGHICNTAITINKSANTTFIFSDGISCINLHSYILIFYLTFQCCLILSLCKKCSFYNEHRTKLENIISCYHRWLKTKYGFHKIQYNAYDVLLKLKR